MWSKIFFFAVVLAISTIGLICVGCAGAQQVAQPQVQAWEYKVVELLSALAKKKPEAEPTLEALLEGVLNDAGKEGWELVVVETGSAVFKRPRQRAK